MKELLKVKEGRIGRYISGDLPANENGGLAKVAWRGPRGRAATRNE